MKRLLIALCLAVAGCANSRAHTDAPSQYTPPEPAKFHGPTHEQRKEIAELEKAYEEELRPTRGEDFWLWNSDVGIAHWQLKNALARAKQSSDVSGMRGPLATVVRESESTITYRVEIRERFGVKRTLIVVIDRDDRILDWNLY